MFARMYAHMSAVPSKVKRGHHIPWNQSYRWFWTVIRMLRTEHGFTAGATGSLSHWAISPGPRLKLTWVCCIFPCYMPWSYSEEWNWHLWAAPRCPELTPAPATAPTNLLFLLPLPLTFTSPAELLDSHLDFRSPLCSPLNHMAYLPAALKCLEKQLLQALSCTDIPPAISTTCTLTWWMETEDPHNSECHRELDYLCIYTPWKVLLPIRAPEFDSCSLCPLHPTAEVRVSTWERGKVQKCVLSDETVPSFPRATLE